MTIKNFCCQYQLNELIYPLTRVGVYYHSVLNSLIKYVYNIHVRPLSIPYVMNQEYKQDELLYTEY